MKQAPWTLLALATLLAGCGGNATPLNNNPGIYSSNIRDAREREEKVTSATTALRTGTNLAATQAITGMGLRLLREAPGNNAMVSPLSVHTALSMALNGAVGDTEKAMRTALGAEKLSVNQINVAHQRIRELLGNAQGVGTLRAANAIWVRNTETPKPTFVKTAETTYGAKITALDFAKPEAVTTINDWVRENTGGLIPKVIDQIAPTEVMMLTNAIYFKAPWAEPFDPANTKPMPFTLAGDKREKVDVPMMTREGSYGYGELDGRQVVVLPYSGNRLDMVFVLEPLQQNANAKPLDVMGWNKLVESAINQKVEVRIPRFSSEFSQEMNAPLTKLGMGIAFEAGKADFRELLETSERLFFSRVIHKTKIEVNEEGAEAAAVTNISVGTTAAPVEREPKRFFADRPFLYAIRERSTGLILFLGRVGDPRPASAEPQKADQ